ncbi:MAG: hypothetical protein KatS3mg033_1415 [Thermonema sp.]|uniref:hypothetical protein n=1 Tax=Thermonema TaxID=28194 RepID=UPI00056F4BD5|nr:MULTISPECIES: hypothetical protein [Thermonema]GIV39615.1 MAG: hypothetical protein KatS3mg033_1415 [Thermonema sp.]
MLLLGGFLCLNPSSPAFAQMSKAEKKAWKKKKKAMNPLAFKQMVEEQEEIKEKINQTRQELEMLRSQLSEKDSRLAQLREENQQLEQQRQEVDATSRQGPDERGVYFRVQVGAYERIDLSSRITQEADMKVEDEGGIKKYTIGYFNDYWEADKFKKYLQSMGIKDAWIVAYRDGVRVDIKEALEGIL